MKNRNRLFAILLALAMIVTYMPALAFADGEGDNWTFYVDEEVFYSNGTDLNSHRAIPGMTLKLSANVDDWAWDDDVREPFNYSWSLKGVDELRCWVDPEEGEDEGHEENLDGYGASDFVTLTGSGKTVSAKFKTKEAVTSGKTQEEKNKLESAYDMGFRILFKVTATRAGESHDSEFDIWVSNDYYEVEPVGNPLEGMAYKDSRTIEPKLFHVTGVDTRTQVTENVDWKWTKCPDDEWADPWEDGWDSIVAMDAHDKDFPVTGPQAGKYTITRKTFDEARIQLWAMIEVDDGDDTRPEYEASEFWVDEQENDLSRYDVYVEGADDNNAIRVSQTDNIGLAIGVRDDRFTLPESAYEIHIYKESWGADEKQVLTPVKNGELTLDEETGTTSIIIYASAKTDSGYTGHTFFEQRGDEYNGVYFDINHTNTLSPFNPKIEFAGYEPRQGERPMTDYYWFSPGEAATASQSLKVSIGGNELEKDTDYTAKYIPGDSDDPDESQATDTLPAKEGTYTLLIKAVQGSDYIGRNDTVKIIILSSGDRKNQEQAENVRYLIEKIQVWFGPEDMNRSAVGPARTAYNALSAEAKKLVYDRWYAQLEDAEFIILMDAVDVNNPSEAAVNAARAQYNKASKVNMYQYWMPEELVEKLKAAEKKIADNKAAQERAAEAARQGVVDKAVAKVKISKPVAAKKAVTVKWNKLSSKDKKKASNIEIWICPNKKFSAADTKIVTVGKGKASKKIKGLKAKTKYYVKVRAIKKVGGVKHYKAWSKVKSVKTK